MMYVSLWCFLRTPHVCSLQLQFYFVGQSHAEDELFVRRLYSYGGGEPFYFLLWALWLWITSLSGPKKVISFKCSWLQIQWVLTPTCLCSRPGPVQPAGRLLRHGTAGEAFGAFPVSPQNPLLKQKLQWQYNDIWHALAAATTVYILGLLVVCSAVELSKTLTIFWEFVQRYPEGVFKPHPVSQFLYYLWICGCTLNWKKA